MELQELLRGLIGYRLDKYRDNVYHRDFMVFRDIHNYKYQGAAGLIPSIGIVIEVTDRVIIRIKTVNLDLVSKWRCNFFRYINNDPIHHFDLGDPELKEKMCERIDKFMFAIIKSFEEDAVIWRAKRKVKTDE